MAFLDEDPTNWLEKGIRPPLKNQGAGVHCLVYSANSAVECLVRIDSLKWMDFSNQQVLDMSPIYGGEIKSKRRFFENLNYKEITTTDNYPPNLKDGQLVQQIFDESKVKFPTVMVRWERISGLDRIIEELKNGPLFGCISIDARFRSIQKPREVYTLHMKGTLNHAILLLGQGNGETGPYFIIQNSWGEAWGNKGRLKIDMEICNIGKCAYKPVMVKDNTMCKVGKLPITIVVMGHVDSGRSTTIGHFIHMLGAFDCRLSQSFEKEAVEMNKRHEWYSWVLDKMQTERDRDITIDQALWRFETTKYICRVVDTTGHCNFMRNMITGTSRADCVVLIIDSTTGFFEEHALLLAFTLGVKNIICCCNKMDATTPIYSQARYKKIVKKVSSHMRMVGYNPDMIPFVPISGLEGDNLIAKSTKLNWYKGPTLLEAFDQIKKARMPSDKPLRLPLRAVDKVDDHGAWPTGRVETGVISSGADVTFAPSGLKSAVKALKKSSQNVRQALPGDQVQFCVSGIAFDALKRGHVASDSKNNPAKGSVSFTAMVIILAYPKEEFKGSASEKKNKIGNGYKSVLECHTSRMDVKISKIQTKLHRRTGKVIKREPEFLRIGDAGVVDMIPTQPMVVEAFSEYPPLGRFLVSDRENGTVMVGVVQRISA